MTTKVYFPEHLSSTLAKILGSLLLHVPELPNDPIRLDGYLRDYLTPYDEEVMLLLAVVEQRGLSALGDMDDDLARRVAHAVQNRVNELFVTRVQAAKRAISVWGQALELEKNHVAAGAALKQLADAYRNQHVEQQIGVHPKSRVRCARLAPTTQPTSAQTTPSPLPKAPQTGMPRPLPPLPPQQRISAGIARLASRTTTGRRGVAMLQRVVNESRLHLRRRPLRSLALVIIAAALLASALYVEICSRTVLGDHGAKPLYFAGIDFGLDYGHLHRVRQFPLLVDARGRGVGMLPPPLIFGTKPDPAYRTTDPGPLPKYWWQLLLAIEDRHRGRWFYVYGVDLKGLLRAFFGGTGGGSTVVMQLAKTIKGQTDVRGTRRFVRKVRDIFHAAVLSRAFARRGEQALARWYATHVAMLRGKLKGIANAAWMLFGKAPAELDLGEQALLAAAVRWRVPMGAGTDWNAERRKVRARLAVDYLVDDGVLKPGDKQRGYTQIDRAATRLVAWQRRPNACGSVDLARTAETSRTKRTDYYAVEHLPDLLNELVRELRATRVSRHGGKPWWRNATIRLSTDIADNCAVRGRIASAWQKLRQRYRDIEAGAWYTVAVANARGELVYFVNSRKTSLYYGPAEPGGRREGLARRELGSFAKVFAALLAARAGDSPETRYLQKTRRRMNGGFYSNYGGSRGRSKRSLTARQAFARSDNLAVMWRLDRSDITQKNMSSLLEAFGFKLNPPTSAPSRSALIEAIALGKAIGTPRDCHRLLQALALALSDRDVSSAACTPRLVSAVRMSGKTNWVTLSSGWSGCDRLVGSLFVAPKQRRFVRAVLSAVVEPGGTAHRALGMLRRSVNPRIDMHLAKTGTVGRGGGSTLYANVGGSLMIDRQLYTYYVQVGPPRGGSLGHRMTGGAAAHLVAPALRALVDKKGAAP
jgi:hypothetical protein